MATFIAGGHFPGEVLEEYCLGKLGESAAAAFEEHLLICAVCRERLERADDFIRASRRAMLQLRDEPGMYSKRFRQMLGRVLFLPGPPHG